MSLTESGRRERLFGGFPTLRKVIEEEVNLDCSKIARRSQDLLPYEFHQGFDPLFRLALQVHSMEMEVINSIEGFNREDLADDLKKLEKKLKTTTKQLNESVRRIEEEIIKIGQMAWIVESIQPTNSEMIYENIPLAGYQIELVRDRDQLNCWLIALKEAGVEFKITRPYPIPIIEEVHIMLDEKISKLTEWLPIQIRSGLDFGEWVVYLIWL